MMVAPLLSTVNVSVAVPTAVALKVTLIVQLCPCASGDEQLLVWEKAALLSAIEETDALTPPVLISVAVAGELLPTSTGLKLSVAGESTSAATTGAGLIVKG